MNRFEYSRWKVKQLERKILDAKPSTPGKKKGKDKGK